MRLEQTIEHVGRRAFFEAMGAEAPAVARRSQDPKHGDYQLNGALPLAKQLGKPPREIAALVADRLRGNDMFASVEVAGPGFINLTLAPLWLAKEVLALSQDRARDGVTPVAKPETVVVDFSGPNIAKQMHVGHIRSTFIGAAITKLLREVGHHVIADNHVGDWGTQFGLLIAGVRRFGNEDELVTADAPIDLLEDIYKRATALAKEDPAFHDLARAELAKLQTGDAANLAMWKSFVAVTRKTLDETYARLGISFDEWRGESSYEQFLPAVVDELLERGIARQDAGAICVFFDDDKELAKVDAPFIVRKKDGAYLYSTTDLATLRVRRDEFHATRVLYVVDARQSLHFKQLFATARKLGFDLMLEHVSFGSVLGSDGKPLKTRDGKAITLRALLDEAEERAMERLRSETGFEIADEDFPRVARAVGLGAVKYADLRQNRTTDYQFEWDKMISFTGNAGPYLQYTYARIASIFRRGAEQPVSTGVLPNFEDPRELDLAREVIRFDDVVHQAAATSQPHLICDHLFGLSRAFSSFYEHCKVLVDDPQTRASRLMLADVVRRQLVRGLGILGIETVERM